MKRSWWLGMMVAAAAVGCSSKNSGSGSGGGDLLIFFSPMYSAFDGVHEFKVPAIADNVDPMAVTWSASDPSMVDLVPDATVGGVMITTRKSGKVQITATTTSGQRGTSTLNITQASPDAWNLGNTRYNNGVTLTGGLMGTQTMMMVACTNCHGDTATMNVFRTVSHTPEQTGGFSDEELIAIFTMATVPRGSYFDSSVVNYNQWHGFHNWMMSPEEAKGIIVYLRSLTPQAQAGRRNFGGRGGGGGGTPPPPGGGGGAGTDAGAATD
jgi:hypothetical protein